ncbi:uncharacterized protein DMENIID0001_167590 [Sergentomyia squamirostris]
MNSLIFLPQISFLKTVSPLRNFATSSVMARKKIPIMSVSRQVKIMDKLMHGRNKGNRHWHEASVPAGAHVGSSSPTSISDPKGQPKHVLRRVTVLNKLFMRNIADIMATGELSGEIVGKGLEICRVKIAPDFRVVNVYWLAKGTDADDEIEMLLGRISGRLRHELSQLRLMGEVPRISFQKDLNFSKFADVDRLLEKADFGEDYVPLQMGQKLKENIAVDKNAEIFPTDALPEMRQDVFGLNHEEIMMKISKTMSKTQSAWEKYEFGALPEEEETPVLRPEKAQKQADKDFELQERFTQFLQNTRNKNQSPERNRFRSELYEIPSKEIQDDPVDNALFEEDYLEAESPEKH